MLRTTAKSTVEVRKRRRRRRRNEIAGELFCEEMRFQPLKTHLFTK